MKEKPLTLPWLASALLAVCFCATLGAAPAHAQGKTPAAPFAEVQIRLERMLDAQFAQLRESNEHRTVDLSVSPMPAVASPKSGVSPLKTEASPQRWQTAHERLLALGVDATRIFAEEGVPASLLRVAAVESNFDPLATSSQGARGLWQLMPETASRFGLRVDARADERTHPARSTRAAARYLRELYLRFGDWPLALAAYNAGEGRVAQALAVGEASDFWTLAERKLLPQETRRYVPAVLGLAIGQEDH